MRTKRNRQGHSQSVIKLGDVIPARNGSRWRRRLPPRQEGAKERIARIVLDVELDADRAASCAA